MKKIKIISLFLLITVFANAQINRSGDCKRNMFSTVIGLDVKGQPNYNSVMFGGKVGIWGTDKFPLSAFIGLTETVTPERGSDGRTYNISNSAVYYELGYKLFKTENTICRIYVQFGKNCAVGFEGGLFISDDTMLKVFCQTNNNTQQIGIGTYFSLK